MENTLKNKAKFFAQHYGQTFHTPNSEGQISFMLFQYWGTHGNKSYIPLKSLSSITDEDAVEVAKIWNWQLDDNKLGIGRRHGLVQIINSESPYGSSGTPFFERQIKAIDYLRSKGYALPWNGISVEQQIEWGWIKLVE